MLYKNSLREKPDGIFAKRVTKGAEESIYKEREGKTQLGIQGILGKNQ